MKIGKLAVLGGALLLTAFMPHNTTAPQKWAVFIGISDYKNFGPEIGVKKSSAQITKYYRLDELVGRQVAAVVNFPPRQIGKFMSEVLTLGFPDGEGNVVLAAIERKVPDGGRLY